MTYVIALPCVDVKDRACIDECPVDCIYEGDRSLYIHPDEWQDYYKANVEFFELSTASIPPVGSPGGAAKVGVIHLDHPVIAAVPPRGVGHD